MTTEKRTKRNCTEDFKWDAVALVIEQGYRISEATLQVSLGSIESCLFDRKCFCTRTV